MSTPKISFRVPNAESEEGGGATGDVITHDVSSAPGKEREREPLYGGELANMGPGDEGMEGVMGNGAEAKDGVEGKEENGDGKVENGDGDEGMF